MNTGTTIGLMVGGAVLLLSLSKPRIAIPGQPAAANPFSSLFNRILPQAAPVNPGALFPQQQLPQQQSYAQPGWGSSGFQNANFSPDYSSGAYGTGGYGTGGYGTGGYAPSQSPSQFGGSPAMYAYPVMTPAGGFQSLAYMSPAPGYQDASYQSASSPNTAGYWV